MGMPLRYKENNIDIETQFKVIYFSIHQLSLLKIFLAIRAIFSTVTNETLTQKAMQIHSSFLILTFGRLNFCLTTSNKKKKVKQIL